MYIPRHFSETDETLIDEFIEDNSFGIIVSTLDNQNIATHIPFVIKRNENGERFLEGHLAKANPQWKSFREDTCLLIIFPGPHTYISSKWYKSERSVPTWNFIAVHVYGKPKIMNDDELRTALEDLIDKNEAGSKEPLKMDMIPSKYARKLMGAVVGFKIKIEKTEAKYKLSQNRPVEDRENIVRKLREREEEDSHRISHEMEKRIKKDT